MLHSLLTSNRLELIKRCEEKRAKRFGPAVSRAVMNHGVPLFLQQVVDTLRTEELALTRITFEPEPTPTVSEIGRAAALHGAEMLRLGFTVDQVVHEYGDVCQSVTDLAAEENAAISNEEFHTLNRCLDNAIADAVTSFGSAHQTLVYNRAENTNTRLIDFREEYERLVEVAIQAFSAIKAGTVGINGATGSLLGHALTELRELAQSTFPEMQSSRTSAATTLGAD